MMTFIIITSTVLFAQPDWEDCPGCYEYTASMTAAIIAADGLVMGDDNDLLAAFDTDGNVRGISTMMDGLEDYEDNTLHAITIRSNVLGDEISFRYYDSSSDLLYYIQDNYTFISNDLVGNLITPNMLNIGLAYEYIELHDGPNLISFSIISEDNTVSNMLSSLSDSAIGIIGEGESALNTNNGWIGALTSISYENGYWLMVNEAATLNLTGIPIPTNQLYNLHNGNNLISYPMPNCGTIDEVLHDNIEECIYAIVGEGVAALNLGDTWGGSLQTLCQNEGYWFVNICSDIDFTFDEPVSLVNSVPLNESPYLYHQSSQQAFYFIQSVENIKRGDWIISYFGNEVIGAREWTGEIIDVPVMGVDGRHFTAGYIHTGSIPTFKLFKNGNLINLTGDIPAWSNNKSYMVENLSEAIYIPDSFSLSKAYPNPFNPLTTINYSLSYNSDVNINVYNQQGKEVASLIKSNMTAGSHYVVWNAKRHASGVYFVKMQADNFVSTQKLILIK